MASRKYPQSLHPMNAVNPLNAMDEVHIIGKLADLKEAYYNQSLILSALSELLIEKGILTTEELYIRVAHLDQSIPTASHRVGRS